MKKLLLLSVLFVALVSCGTSLDEVRKEEPAGSVVLVAVTPEGVKIYRIIDSKGYEAFVAIADVYNVSVAR